VALCGKYWSLTVADAGAGRAPDLPIRCAGEQRRHDDLADVAAAALGCARTTTPSKSLPRRPVYFLSDSPYEYTGRRASDYRVHA
jgi:hypothetical protein